MNQYRRFLTFRNLFSRRPHVIKIVPELLSKFSLNEVLFLCLIDYFIVAEHTKNGFSTSWLCSFQRLHKKFLPFFSKTTLWRIIRDLKKMEVLETISNSRAISWSINYDRIVEILETKNIDEKVFQSETKPETTNNVPPNFHSNILEDKAFQSEIIERKITKPADLLSSPVQNPTRKEKKESSSSIDLSETLRERKPARESVKFETLQCQIETKQCQIETIDSHLKIHLPSQSALTDHEKKMIKQFSNEPEKDAEIMSKFKETFGGEFSGWRKASGRKVGKG